VGVTLLKTPMIRESVVGEYCNLWGKDGLGSSIDT
jgi:hypothetical protein